MEIKHRIDLNKLLPKHPVTCEVGVAEGYYSQHICQHWQPTFHYCVDNWGHISNYVGDGNFPQDWHDMNYTAAKFRMKDFEDRVKFLRGPSWRMSQHVQDESLDFVYLDAGHDYESVRKDLEAWYPKVKPGGIVAGHDFLNNDYGVNQAVTEFARIQGVEVLVTPENKSEDAGFYFKKPTKKS